ncbi:uncharacterized protein LOC115688781 [Syzygium oleosum]|uniref:uncharacterized protein LOC115688781 n=1 Tax=Syzygium oleosum TaxID=219896 RepID=UPI0024BA640C|nr:uncharacterized protein LOC115688781 [Syzygium oleosum]
MDRGQKEMQFLGFFGIIKESIKIIFTWRKIFSQITLALLLSLSFIIFAYRDISHFLTAKIQHDQRALNHAKADTPKYNKLSNLAISDIIELCLFSVANYIRDLIFSLLSTSTVMYTIACMYTLRSITFGRAINVIQKVGKRLMITLLWSFLALFVYIINIIVTILICYLLFDLIHFPAIGLILVFILLILFLFGLVYVSVILDLAGVISVLEDIYGLQAMYKSKNLIKGKTGISLAIKLLLTIGSMAIHTVFNIFMANGYGSGFLRFGDAVLCFLFLLFGLVTQTMIYLACRSYHDENINKSALLLAE